jgi:glycerol-3-phosphate dehydrogenase (NAD(P)+)
MELARKYGVELPITNAAYEVLYEGKAVAEEFHKLMTRRKNHEVEDAWV